MYIFKEIEALRAFLLPRRVHPASVGFVPTMGALHEGHLSLIRKSKRENSLTVCSIYVNPTQFNNATDLEKYPRTLEADVNLLESEKCDVLFAPDNSEMYRTANTLRFDFDQLDKSLEGKFRPGHFSGVALVVAKLFNIVHPTRAYFGQKDYQQFLIISRLVEELQFDIELDCFPTVREGSGLALSSRNKRLTEEGKEKALALIDALKEARRLLLDRQPWEAVKHTLGQKLQASGSVRLEYFELVDRANLIPFENVTTENLSNAILLIAAYVEEVRLIDNLFVVE